MGNQSSNYTIEKFLAEFDTSNLNQMQDKEIREKLESVLSIFRQDKNYYSSLKKEDNLQNAIDFGSKYQNEISDEEKSLSKTWRFCNLITFYIKITFVDKDIPSLILDIFSLLSKLYLILYAFYNLH